MGSGQGALSQTVLCLLQRMLQLTAAQKASISALRTAYITKVSLLAKQRRQLLWMLQQMPAVKAGHSQLEATRNAEENIAQKLQGLVTTENKLFVELSSSVGHGVSPASIRQSGNHLVVRSECHILFTYMSHRSGKNFLCSLHQL